MPHVMEFKVDNIAKPNTCIPGNSTNKYESTVIDKY
jgi:hypothetical protein